MRAAYDKINGQISSVRHVMILWHQKSRIIRSAPPLTPISPWQADIYLSAFFYAEILKYASWDNFLVFSCFKRVRHFIFFLFSHLWLQRQDINMKRQNKTKKVRLHHFIVAWSTFYTGRSFTRQSFKFASRLTSFFFQRCQLCNFVDITQYFPFYHLFTLSNFGSKVDWYGEIT